MAKLINSPEMLAEVEEAQRRMMGEKEQVQMVPLWRTQMISWNRRLSILGDISIIARRLSDKYVQYGWSGNGGYFKIVGASLLEWYNTPDMVEYLFGLGQLRQLGKPYSERSTAFFRTVPTGEAHWVDPSERWIFSKIAFIDFGYFYDTDQKWYLVKPGPFRIKIPLTLVENNLDDRDYEFDFLQKVNRLVFNEILSERHMVRLESTGLDGEALQKLRADLIQKDFPLYELWNRHKSVCDCFDDWVLIRPDESGKNVSEIVLRPKEEPHTETIFW